MYTNLRFAAIIRRSKSTQHNTTASILHFECTHILKVYNVRNNPHAVECLQVVLYWVLCRPWTEMCTCAQRISVCAAVVVSILLILTKDYVMSPSGQPHLWRWRNRRQKRCGPRVSKLTLHACIINLHAGVFEDALYGFHFICDNRGLGFCGFGWLRRGMWVGGREIWWK